MTHKIVVFVKRAARRLAAGLCGGGDEEEGVEWEMMEPKKRKRPEVVVVHEIELKRKKSSADLREESKRSSKDEDKRVGVEDLHSPSTQNEDGDGAGHYHAMGHPPDENAQFVPMPAVPRAGSTVKASRPRPKALVIEAGVPIDFENLDTAVSPTNVQTPFRTPPETPSSFKSFSGNDHSGPIDDPPAVPSIPSAYQPRTTSPRSNYVDSQARFDSYVDAINDEAARRCSLHAVLSTDIARLVAELDVLHNRIAMANVRAAYNRRSTLITLGEGRRPESWSQGPTQPIAHTCSCGQRWELRAEGSGECEEDNDDDVQGETRSGAREAKRQTWHAEPSPSRPLVRAPSPESSESETEREVMLRHSAGTNLFRFSHHEGAKNRGRARSSESENERPSQTPRVEVSKSFDFRRESERVAERVRPTFGSVRI